MTPPAFFATASRGTEGALVDELRGLGIDPATEARGGVAFGSSLEHAYTACLWSRVASRVLMPLKRFEAGDAEALYGGVHDIDWSEHLGPERTLAVDVAGSASPAGPSHFLALKTKDAIVDRVRSIEGARPSVDKRRPDVRIHVHVRGASTTISLDLAGAGLHHRGLGRKGGIAPLRENLAAALLRIAGWPDASTASPFFDPMCGSGTLLIEAAAMALDVAPGLTRSQVGFEGWRGHDASLWSRLRKEARERRRAARRKAVRVAGTDASLRAVRAAAELIERAGFGRYVRCERGNLDAASPPWTDPGIVITNPPYGERLGDPGTLGPLYETLGDVLKRRFPGWTAWVLSGSRALDKRVGLRAASRTVVFNGPIECRLLELPISPVPVSGSGGPGWRRPSDEARGFARRLKANARELESWARSARIEAYRLYDADVPTHNVTVDRYGPFVRIHEGRRPRGLRGGTAERRLLDISRAVPEVLEIEPVQVIVRAAGCPPKTTARGPSIDLTEGDLRFRVDPSVDPDGGLALDERGVRSWVRENARDRDVLVLEAGTCTTSVAAVAGGARSTASVDPSRSNLDWGRQNFDLNGLAGPRHRFHRSLPTARGARYDLAVHVASGYQAESLSRLARLVRPGGLILLGTRDREVALDDVPMEGFDRRDIGRETTPRDFASRPRLSVWLFSVPRHHRR